MPLVSEQVEKYVFASSEALSPQPQEGLHVCILIRPSHVLPNSGSPAKVHCGKVVDVSQTFFRSHYVLF